MNLNKPIGGYFELELQKGIDYHNKALRLNTGRNALELILKIKKFTKVYIPFFSCDVIIEPFIKLNISIEYYSIDNNFEPKFDLKKIKEDEGFLYINYFGLKDLFVNKIVKNCKNLIIDNSQAFFSRRIASIPTFYSCRKFFGVPDGAYLYLDEDVSIDLPKDHSENRFTHLLKRIEYGAEAGYEFFTQNEEGLINQPTKTMSRLTFSLLKNIDYEKGKKIRNNNFMFLHEKLNSLNEITIDSQNINGPLVYPLLCTNGMAIKEKMLDHKIFLATYWQNVANVMEDKSFEAYLARNLLPLPIDQRYSSVEMNKIILLIKRKKS